MNTNKDSKRILAYGDSLTWGRIANQFERYDVDTRWTGVLQSELGDDYDVIEEGLRGRFLAGENPFVPNRDGLAQFGPILASHFPLDLVIIMLGTNDTNSKANKSTDEIARGLYNYFQEINKWVTEFQVSKPRILVISPPLIDDTRLKENSMFEGATSKSQNFAQEFEKVANDQGVFYFDSSVYAPQDGEDGVHISGESQQSLGKNLAPFVREILV
ncbi:MAG: GDSL-type esterase/lipase family protein [Patescibacteria group bacterium]